MYILPTIALFGVFAFGNLVHVPIPAFKTELHTKEEKRETIPVLLSSYNAVPEQTDGDPMTTASGLRSNPEVMAARSRDLAESLPYGTVIRLAPSSYDESTSCGLSKVEGKVGYRVITDTMHARKVGQVDIMLDHTDTVILNGRERNPSVVLGLCDGVQIEVVGKLEFSDIPKTQIELRRIFEKEIALR
jgi:3D (Asp-Asp-Asp) domain-containing protein